jgi:hypothetical protein
MFKRCLVCIMTSYLICLENCRSAALLDAEYEYGLLTLTQMSNSHLLLSELGRANLIGTSEFEVTLLKIPGPGLSFSKEPDKSPCP